MKSYLSAIRWTLLGLLAAVLLGILVFARVITDWLWFVELSYPSLFIQPVVWQLATGAGAALVALIFVALNLAIASRAGGGVSQRWEDRQPWGAAGRWSRRAAILGALLAALVAGVSFANQWSTVVMGIAGGEFGVVDPLFGLDAGFYIFRLPLLELVQAFALGLLVFTALGAGVIYVASGALAAEGPRVRLTGRARAHLATLLALAAAVHAAGYRLSAYELVYSTRGGVYGAGYTDVHATLPALWVMTAASLFVAVALVAYAIRPRLRWVVTGLVVLVAAAVIGTGVYPTLVQEFVVRPNELEKELPYIGAHLQMTRAAYGLADLKQLDYDPGTGITAQQLREHERTLANIRLWDYRPLLRTYSQLQELRPYYDFIEVDIDRYRIGGEYRQVMLAARELTSTSLQNRSWVNLHLQYTHGYGVVMSPVNEADARGLPRFFLSDIPPRGTTELVITRPEIYYGEQDADYVIVRTRRPEFDYPLGDDNATAFYEGNGGIAVGGWLRRALLAARLGTTRLLLSQEITPESRVMLYRTIPTRLRKLAPFLRFDSDPYLVIAGGRLFWIADAYTSTSLFPYSTPTPGWGNYVRNSVKAVVDAYHGSVDFYIADDEPLIRALARLYPGVFKPISEMPAELREHVRYPEDLFRLQASILTRYHMTNPQVFYNQEDVWELPREIYERTEVEMEPYYVITRLPGEAKEEFILMLPFTPLGKGNMVAWLAARNDGDAYGELVLYRFGKQEVTFGPLQFEARVNQDTEISRELTLWSQQGSRVIRGNLIIVPIADTLLYVEPLFLQAERGEIPELKQVIVGTGDNLVMRPTLAEGLAALVGEPSSGGVLHREAGLTPERPGQRPAGAPAETGSLRSEQPDEVSASRDEPQPDPIAGAGDAADLVTRAAALFDEAKRHAGAGDWSGYGQALEELGAVLEQLKAIVQDR